MTFVPVRAPIFLPAGAMVAGSTWLSGTSGRTAEGKEAGRISKVEVRGDAREENSSSGAEPEALD